MKGLGSVPRTTTRTAAGSRGFWRVQRQKLGESVSNARPTECLPSNSGATYATRTSCFSLEILLTRNTRSPACTLAASETSAPAELTTIVEVSSRNAARETGASPEFTIIVEASSWNPPGASRHPRTSTGTCNGWRSLARRRLACAGGAGGFGRGSSPTVESFSVASMGNSRWAPCNSHSKSHGVRRICSRDSLRLSRMTQLSLSPYGQRSRTAQFFDTDALAIGSNITWCAGGCHEGLWLGCRFIPCVVFTKYHEHIAA